MKEQDLREKISESIDQFDDLVLSKDDATYQCVQIAKDYAEQEAIEFNQWMHENTVYSGNGFYSVILGGKKYKHNQKLTECYQLFKNRENER